MNSANPASGNAFAHFKSPIMSCPACTPRPIALVVLACVALACGLAQAQNTWTGSAGTTNWSIPGNWSFGTAPTAADTVVFDNTTTPFAPAGVVDNIVDANFTIYALNYQTVSTNGYHTTFINPGVSLNINGTTANAFWVQFPGSVSGTLSVYDRFIGPGTLTVTNTTGAINASQGGGNNDHYATLDLSGLTNFSASVGQIFVGCIGDTTTYGLRPMGVMRLADTNFIQTAAGTTQPGILVGGYPTSDTNLRGTQQMFLGRYNVINSDAITMGGQKTTGQILFRSGLTGGSAILRGSAGGADKVKLLTIGDQRAGMTGYGQNGSSASNPGTLDTTGNSIDARVLDLYVARGGTNSTSTTTGTLTFDQGTITADNLYVGYHPTGLPSSGQTANANGTINVNGTATLTVNNDIQLSRKLGSSTPIGTLNLGSNATVNVTGNLLVAAGSGTVNFNSGGRLNLAGDLVNSNGTATVNFNNGGILDLEPAGDATQGSALISTLTGSGTITNAANVTNLVALTPGGVATAGTLTIYGNLVMSNNAALNISLTNVTTPGGNLNDLVSVNGNVTLNNNPLSLAPNGGSLASGSYQILTNTGTRTGSLNLTNPTRYTLTLNYLANEVDLAVSGSPGSVRWNSASSTAWDLTTSNWFNTGSSATDKFLQSDSVLVDDSGTFTNLLLLSTSLYANTVTVNSSTRDYFFGGIGKLSGAASLTKNGTSTLTISNANDFTGPVQVNAGILRVVNASALGATNGGTTIASGATLDIFGSSLYSPGELITIAGTGLNSTGAVINTGAAQNNGIRYLTLSDNATIRGDNRFDVRGPSGSGSFSGTLDLNSFTLTKLGAAQQSLADVMATNAGSIIIGGGILGLTRSMVDGPGYINVLTNILLFENSSTGYMNKAISVAGGIIRATGNALTVNSPITNLAPGVTIDNSVQLTLTNIITGAGALTKSSAGTLVLLAPDTCTGPTTIAAGRLTLSTNSSLALTPSIAVAANALLDVSALSGGFTLLGSQTLSGSGAVIGDVSANPGTIIILGTSPGTLTFSNNLTLNSVTNVIELGSDPTQIGNNVNDLIAVSSNLTLSGVSTIKISPLGPLDTTTPYTIVVYSNILSGTLANLQVTSDNPRYTFSVVDPATTPGAIKIVASGNPVLLVWQGGQPVNPTAWDYATVNWLNISTANPDLFYGGDTTVFNDTASTNAVQLIGIIQPGTMVVSNNALSYALGGAGLLNAGSLTKQGAASLIISNSAANTISSAMTIDAGSLTFANAGANTFGSGAPVTVNSGSLTLGNSAGNTFNKGLTLNAGTTLVANAAANTFGPDILLNSGTLTFNQPLDVTVSTVISNAVPLTAGLLVKQGANMLTLSGNNTGFDGSIQINAGTLKTSNGNALGNANGTTTIANGATLDVNGQNLNGEPVVVSGSGVGGNGAIINTGGGQNNALGSVTLTDNTTFGGTGRWDVRNLPALFSTGGQPYKLTKAGPNQTSLVNCTVDAALGDVDIQSGILGIEVGSTLGDPAYTVTVRSNATLQFWNLTTANPVNKVMVLSNTATVNNGSGANLIIGPVTLNGDVNFNIAGTSLQIDSAMGGPGNLIKLGANTLILNGLNSYVGSTFISAGTLQLGANSTTGNLPPQPSGVLTNNGTLVFARADDLAFSDQITGSGAVQQTFGGTMFLTASNSYSGQTTLNGTTASTAALRISNGSALGSTNGITSINGNTTGNSRLELVGGITVPETFSLSARQAATIDSPHIESVSGINTLTGPINGTTGGSEYNIQADAGSKLIVAGNFVPPSSGGTRRLKLMGDGNGEWSGIISNGTDNTTLTTFAKTGLGTWTLSGSNVYRGTTTILAGTLALAATGSLNSTPTIDVQAGASFDVSAVPGGFALIADQTLKGNGTVLGSVNVRSNATLSVGESIGALTVTNALAFDLGSTNIAEIDKLNGTNDGVYAASVSYGGTLVVTEISGSLLVAGDTFKLFTAATYGGVFAALSLPPLDPSLGWNTSKLAVDGTIKVVPGISTTPTNIQWSVSGGNLTLSWPLDHLGWTLLVQTNNLATGVSVNPADWGPLPGSTTTNEITISLDAAKPAGFYRMAFPYP